MKNLLRGFKTLFLALLPFVTSIKFSVAAGGALSLHLPALAPLAGNYTALLATALYWLELLVRVVPTSTDFSPLNFLLQLLQAMAPNRAVSVAGVAGDFVNLSHYRQSPVPVAFSAAISPAYVSSDKPAAGPARAPFPHS